MSYLVGVMLWGWHRVVLAVVATPVTAYAGFLAILYTAEPATSS